ncbi:MAG: peptidase U32 [Firmicutes bacterium HGW-Firmicutes-1]|jgi:putative protease|nr:MAG: peptidase U32 [Firmicutes bacterium HGW-Firmicutes-1]
MKKPELLIPAGSLENLIIAVKYGADAVYIGGEEFGLRAKAKNFTMEDMKEGIRYAHENGVKVYVTANIIAHNDDLEGVLEYFRQLKEIKPDGLIVADPGILDIARAEIPEIEIHLSTQANNTNYAALNFWHKQGVKRVVVARELSFKEITTIRLRTPKDLDLEAFVHGAMCISYSGRCLLSNYMTERDANKGECTHPCRWTYNLVEETRPGEYMPVYENERGTYIYNSKDLCMIEYIGELMKSGIHSFKIEGRMKTQLYVATVTRAYRQAIDDYLKDPELYKRNLPHYLEEVKKCSHRNFTTGFYLDKPAGAEQIYNTNTYIRNYTYVGKVLDYIKEEGIAIIEQRNKFVVGDELEIMKSDGRNSIITVQAISDMDGNSQQEAPHPKQILKIPVNIEVEKDEIIRKKE